MTIETKLYRSETAQILGMTQVMVSRRERKLLKELREQLV